MDYKEESSADKQKRLNCNVGRGINGWNCYIDCASWDEHICTQFETATVDELKPCPFCGGDAFIYLSGSNGIGIFAEVHCKECHASTDRIKIGVNEMDADTNIAIEAWNRRV